MHSVPRRWQASQGDSLLHFDFRLLQARQETEGLPAVTSLVIFLSSPSGNRSNDRVDLDIQGCDQKGGQSKSNQSAGKVHPRPASRIP